MDFEDRGGREALDAGGAEVESDARVRKKLAADGKEPMLPRLSWLQPVASPT